MQAFCVLISSEKEMFVVRKKSNRVFSILLTLVMLLGMLPAPAQAASAAFTAQPQSGTTNIGEEYAFNWANGQTPVSLKLQIANLANSEDPWEDLQTLSGTSGTVGYRPNSDPSDPDAKIYVRDGNSAYRIVALVVDRLLGVVEVPSDTFVVTWTANITFDANGGTGTMESATCNVGSQYILPECTFTAPAGKMFDCWSVGGSKKTAGSKVTVPVNTTVKAQWEDIPTSITITIKDGIASWTQIPDADEYLCKVSNTMYVARVMPSETFDVDAWIKEHLDFSGSYTLTVRACKDSEVLMESEIEYEYTTTHTHLWSTDWSCDDTHHWRECIADGCGIKSIYYLGTIGRHEYSSDGICIYCGKTSAAWLDSPTITIKDGVASWTQVEGATKYKWWLKTVNGLGEVTNWVEPGDTLDLNEMLSFLDREGGTYLFSVQPFADEYTPLSAKAVVEYEYIRHYEVTFDGNGGSGGMKTVYGIRGQYTLPESTAFTAPSGKQFKAWSVNGKEYAPGDTITVSADTTVTAIWTEPIITITIEDGVASWTQIPSADRYKWRLTNGAGWESGGWADPDETFDLDACIAEWGKARGTYTFRVTPYSGEEPITETSEIYYEYTTTHVHSWATNWTTTKVLHYRKCTADGCGILHAEACEGYGFHTFNDGICPVCGYVSALEKLTLTIEVVTIDRNEFDIASWTQVPGATHYFFSIDAAEAIHYYPGDTVELGELFAKRGKSTDYYTIRVTAYNGSEVISETGTAEYYYNHHYAVTFDANGGSGTMKTVYTLALYYLPECTFTPPANKQFKCWMVDGEEYTVGDDWISVWDDKTVKAVWEDAPPRFITPPQSGTAEKTEEYIFSWELDRADTRVVLMVYNPSSGNWMTGGTLTGETSYTVKYWGEDLCVDGKTRFKLCATRNGKTTESEFTVTWLGPLAFTKPPQSGTAEKTEEYTFDWELNRPADDIVLKVYNPNSGNWMIGDRLTEETSYTVRYWGEDLCVDGKTRFKLCATLNGNTIESEFAVLWADGPLSGTVTVKDGAATASVIVADLSADEATLLVAQYRGGQMVDVKLITIEADRIYQPTGTFRHQPGDHYRAFLVDAETYAPLCAAAPLSE